MLGHQGIKDAFAQNDLSDTYWIHRTRRNFPDLTSNQEGEDTFLNMAKTGVSITEQVILERMAGQVDIVNNQWIIPK
jgi:hypothetical protein